MNLKPFICGLAGLAVTEWERDFLHREKPLGLILFARNIDTPDQVRTLTQSFRTITDNPQALVLIDQEGGRVARLKPPHWRAAPPMACFGALYHTDPALAREALALNCRLLSHELTDLGINVNCLPVLDLPQPDADPIISDRAFGADPEMVADLGRVAMDALMAGGVLPVIKHIPGHGRAKVDSHESLPVVETDLDTLHAHDFKPFHALADAPLAMTAHIRYTALDPKHCVTQSPASMRFIRDKLNFSGLIMTDDLSMKALGGGITERARTCLDAGCDILLHCNADSMEMQAVAAACPDTLSDPLAEMLVKMQAGLGGQDGFAADAAQDRLIHLLA